MHNFVSSFCYASSSLLYLYLYHHHHNHHSNFALLCWFHAGFLQFPLLCPFSPAGPFWLVIFLFPSSLRRLPTLARRGARQVPSLPRPPLPAIRPASSCPIQTCLRLLRLRNRFLVLTFRPLRPIMLQMRRCSPPGLQRLLHRVLLQSRCNPRQLRCLSFPQQLRSRRIKH